MHNDLHNNLHKPLTLATDGLWWILMDTVGLIVNPAMKGRRHWNDDEWLVVKVDWSGCLNFYFYYNIKIYLANNIKLFSLVITNTIMSIKQYWLTNIQWYFLLIALNILKIFTPRSVLENLKVYFYNLLLCDAEMFPL